jgi:hypothetical protein
LRKNKEIGVPIFTEHVDRALKHLEKSARGWLIERGVDEESIDLLRKVTESTSHVTLELRFAYLRDGTRRTIWVGTTVTANHRTVDEQIERVLQRAVEIDEVDERDLP